MAYVWIIRARPRAKDSRPKEKSRTLSVSVTGRMGFPPNGPVACLAKEAASINSTPTPTITGFSGITFPARHCEFTRECNWRNIAIALIVRQRRLFSEVGPFCLCAVALPDRRVFRTHAGAENSSSSRCLETLYQACHAGTGQAYQELQPGRYTVSWSGPYPAELRPDAAPGRILASDPAHRCRGKADLTPHLSMASSTLRRAFCPRFTICTSSRSIRSSLRERCGACLTRSPVLSKKGSCPENVISIQQVAAAWRSNDKSRRRSSACYGSRKNDG